MEIGEKIKLIRQGSGFSQADFCELIDLDQASLSNIERGKYDPSLSLLRKMAKAFGCKLEINFE